MFDCLYINFFKFNGVRLRVQKVFAVRRTHVPYKPYTAVACASVE